MIRPALILAAVLAPSLALAGFHDGNELHRQCQAVARGDAAKDVYLLGYASGLFDSFEIEQEMTKKHYICAPDKFILTQVRDIMCGYISNHPEKRQWTGAVLGNLALIEAWPCQKSQQ